MTQHTPPLPDQLERQLADLTTYRGDSTSLWQMALESSNSRATASKPWLRLRSPITAACLIAACLVLFVALFFPPLGQARRVASHRASPSLDSVAPAAAPQ